jgi:hypothetical protein
VSPSKIASKKSLAASKTSGATVSTSTASVSEPVETKPVTPAVSPTVASTPATAAASPAFLAKVAQCTALLDQAIALFQDGTNLTATDRVRITKIRKGGSKVIPILAQAAKQAGVNLPLAPVAPMEESLAEAQALVPVQAKIGVLQKQIADHVYTSEGASWATATALYAVLRRLSKHNGQLTTLLVPATEFFAYRASAVRAEHPKTKQGKQVLAQKKAAQAPLASASSSSPETADSPGAYAPAPAASPTVAVPNGAALANGASNGAAHS